MRYTGFICSLILISASAHADLTPEESCEKRGEVAMKASELRLSGTDKETATSDLIEKYAQPGSGVTENNVRGMVMVSYMAKMKPENMRNYAIDQCKKDILK